MLPADVDETDLVLISALQEVPRARWVELSDVLQLGPDVLAQRWHRLNAAGLAWIAVDEVHPGSRALTHVLVGASGTARAEVIERTVADRRVRTVHGTSGATGLCIYLETRDAKDAARCIAESIEAVPGVTSVTAVPVAALITSGADWRTRALSEPQTAALRALRAPIKREPVRAVDPVSAALQRSLSLDGRASVVELTRRLRRDDGLSVSESTVARRLQRLVEDPSTRIRCDVSPADLGWRAVTMFWLRVPAQLAASLAARASSMRLRLHNDLPEVRSLMVTVAAANVHVTAWLRRVEEVPAFEAALLDWLGGGEVIERMLCNTHHKRMGFALVDGRRLSG